MAVNFGELDYFGHAPANELKDKIRGIAYSAIMENLTREQENANSFRDFVDGVMYVTEMIFEEIDDEVAHKAADVQQILQMFEKTGRLEEGGADGNP